MDQNAANDEDRRDRALKRLRKKSEFNAHLLSYLFVNMFLVALWATVADGGFFWPIFPMLAWGIGVFFHGWDVYKAEPTEQDIRRELERMS